MWGYFSHKSTCFQQIDVKFAQSARCHPFVNRAISLTCPPAESAKAVGHMIHNAHYSTVLDAFLCVVRRHSLGTVANRNSAMLMDNVCLKLKGAAPSALAGCGTFELNVKRVNPKYIITCPC